MEKSSAPGIWCLDGSRNSFFFIPVLLHGLGHFFQKLSPHLLFFLALPVTLRTAEHQLKKFLLELEFHIGGAVAPTPGHSNETQCYPPSAEAAAEPVAEHREQRTQLSKMFLQLPGLRSCCLKRHCLVNTCLEVFLHIQAFEQNTLTQEQCACEWQK